MQLQVEAMQMTQEHNMVLSPAAAVTRWRLGQLFSINLTACPADGAQGMRMLTPQEMAKSGQNPSGPIILEADNIL